MRDGSQRGTNGIFIAQGHHATTVTGAILFFVLAINGDVLRIVHRTSVIQVVKQIIQLSRKSAQRCDGRAAFNTCSRLIKVYETYHQPTAASGKTRQGSQD
jgi:hypothetical protein